MRRRFEIDPLDVALGEATGPDVARLLREDPKFREAVESMAPVVARLQRQPSDAWDAPEPPPLVVGAPLAPRARRRRPRLAFVLRPSIAVALSLAFVAAGFGLGSLLGGGGDRVGPGSPVGGGVALTPLPGQFGSARLVTAGEGRVRLDAAGLAPDERSYHELWLLPADGEGDPVPVGRFRVGADGEAHVLVDLPPDAGSYALFDVSHEPADGDPKHSGRSVLRAPVSDS